MDKRELYNIKSMALTYGDPLRGKILSLIATIESLEVEVEVYKKNAVDYEEMYKQEHIEKNALRRQFETLKHE